MGRLLGVSHHIRKAGIYQGLSLFIKAYDPNGVGKIFQGVDDAFVYFKIHGTVTAASGFLHQFHIAGRAELAPEIAGVTGINVDHIGCPQRQCVFQFHPVVNVNTGNLFCFHGLPQFRMIQKL
jgi:hypothetical protein